MHESFEAALVKFLEKGANFVVAVKTVFKAGVKLTNIVGPTMSADKI